MKRKALIMAGTDGHGATMGVVSHLNLEAEGYETELFCKYPETGRPSQFWGQTFQRDLSDYKLVVVTDIPLPEPDGYFPNAVADGIAKIQELVNQGIRVVLVDHHKVAETHYGRARDAGAEVILTSSASTCFYGEPSEFSEKWGRIGAICDLDSAVLPVTEEEEKIALGLDVGVRTNMKETLEAIKSDNVAYFAEKGFLPEVPGKITVQGNVAMVSELTGQWAFKQLSRICQETGCDYAVGLNFERGAAVHAVTFWKSNALPVALKLGLARFIGHGSAIVLPVGNTLPTPDEDKAKAKSLMMELVERLNTEEPIGNGNSHNGGDASNLFGYVSAFMRRVHVPFFLTLHGWGHVEHVIGNARSLGSLFGLNNDEQRLLDWAALFHDVGNGASTVYGVDEKEARERHHEFSAMMILEWKAQGLFRDILSDEDVETVAELCLRHRKKMSLPEDERMRLLEVILRVSDGMDIDARRAQRNDQGAFFEELDLPKESIRHWEGHRAIEALRLRTGEAVTFEVIVSDPTKAAFQVAEITKELAPLTEFCDWEVRVSSASVSVRK